MNDGPTQANAKIIWTSKDGTHRCEHASTPEHCHADLEAIGQPTWPIAKLQFFATSLGKPRKALTSQWAISGSLGKVSP